jgi:hypothetical protein
MTRLNVIVDTIKFSGPGRVIQIISHSKPHLSHFVAKYFDHHNAHRIAKSRTETEMKSHGLTFGNVLPIKYLFIIL